MREDLLKRAEQELAQKRLENEQTEIRRQEEVRVRHPEIYRMVTERQDMILGSLRGILQGKAAAEDLPDQMEKLSCRIQEALKQAGYEKDYLAPVYACPHCKDAGYFGEPVREMCSCLESIYQRLLREEIGLNGQAGETFENYDETLFSAEPLEGKAFSQRQVNASVRMICERWADQWPEQQPRDMVLSGKSGLGKTYFLHAMASRLIERGCQVLPVSAYSFLEIARKSYFEDEEGMDFLIHAEVLMIDDLGSEPLMKNVTIEQLFNLINERQRNNLATVISTNLSVNELKERYTERIVSRLTDRTMCNFIRLEGKDIRNGRG